MDRSEVRYRDLLDSLRAVSDRPVIPHQYAIGRGDELVGYIDLVTEKAYAYKPGGPSEPIELPDRISANASRRRARKCWKRLPISTTT